MKKYTAPEAEAIVLQSADCITFSVGNYALQRDTLDYGENWD